MAITLVSIKKIEITFRSHIFFQTCQHFHCLVLVAVWWWWTGGEHFSAGSRLHAHYQVWSSIYGSLRHMHHPCCRQHADSYDGRLIPQNQGHLKGLLVKGLLSMVNKPETKTKKLTQNN